MKKSMFILTAALLSLTSLAEVKVTHFPADTKLLVHLDVKRLVNSKTGDLLKESMDDKSRRKMDSFKALSGIDFMRDLDSVYVMGTGGEKDKGAVYATGRFDVNKLTAILGGNDDFKSEPFGAHNILTWTDKGETHHGCFVNSGLAVASDNMDVLKNCLGLLDGKGESLAADSAFAAIVPGQANRFVSLAAHDVDSLASAGSSESGQPGKPNQLQMLQSAKSLIFCVDQTTADRADLMLRAAVSAADVEKAQQLAAMAQGIQAMMMMQAAENPEVAKLAQSFSVQSEETKVKMSFKLTEEQLRKQIEEAKKKAADRPAGEEDVPPPVPAQVVEPQAVN